MQLFKLSFGNDRSPVTGIEPVTTGEKAAIVDFANGDWAFVSTNLQRGGQGLWTASADGTYEPAFLTDGGFLDLNKVEKRVLDSGDPWIVKIDGERRKMKGR